ncbi:MAG: aminodeoxychorismate synthase component I, partial [Rhodospirillales bacterium]|nr:aminodeoxychorismate synthase component I [Rhodospirillales bacterium]
MAEGTTRTEQPAIEQPARGDECVLLHDSLSVEAGQYREPGRGSVVFSDPVRIITCQDGDDVASAFAAIECATDEGLYIAGAFAYELGYHLEPKLTALAPVSDDALFQVGAFRSMTRLSPEEADSIIAERAQRGGAPVETDLHYHMDSPAYDKIMSRLHDYILAGDIYQANFTFPLSFTWPGDVWQLYGLAAPFQKVAFSAVVDLPGYKLASLSPELFFRKSGGTIESKPMKGTMRRGATPDEDDALREALHNDPKNRAENLMIVDLIRNDLGRMAQLGSVAVENLFQVETYSTLHQMVSTVRAEVEGVPTVHDIFRHLFPCGSVTGAPKIRAMEIIAELETAPRGVYTGAIGYVTPSHDMCLSVPIRTMTLRENSEVSMGIGSGVVADSSAAGEYDECLLKARFLNDALSDNEQTSGQSLGQSPGLIETMRGVDGTVPLLDHHRARLHGSAASLGIVLDEGAIWDAVAEHAAGRSDERRIRLQLNADSTWRVESSPLGNPSDSLPVVPVVIIGSERVQSTDPLLAHKTTRRAMFDRARLALADIEGGFDVLLFNERDELCEGAISNVFLMLDGQLVTPDLACGLLPGVMRARVMIEKGAVERVLYEGDVRRAETV